MRCLAVIHSLRPWYKLRRLMKALNEVDSYLEIPGPLLEQGLPFFIVQRRKGFSADPLRHDLHRQVKKVAKDSARELNRYEPRKDDQGRKKPYHVLRRGRRHKLYQWVKILPPPLPSAPSEVGQADGGHKHP
ncbi:MAG: hypothetical protein KF802_10580 [Bdellovibrionaceae bacterium]|nr:hypothetical protein [Pseudobdellovibrionaceae bacterium]